MKLRDYGALAALLAILVAATHFAWQRWGLRTLEVAGPLAAVGVFGVVLESRRRLVRELRAMRRDGRRIEALISLVPLLDHSHPLPDFGPWSVSPDLASLLVGLVDRHRPTTVLELGAGASTVLLAYRMKKLGHGKIVSWEHDAAYAKQAAELLADHGLSEYAEVVHAPLTDVVAAGRTWKWYDPRALQSLPPIDLLVIDGPPSWLQPLSRFPALPLLAGRLAEMAVVVLDDADRKDEKRIVEMWTKEYPGIQCRNIVNEKGAVVLTACKAAFTGKPAA